MKEEISRPGCPVKHTAQYVPPRFQQGPITTALNLGPLAFLVGSWRGSGFNSIWRPDNPQSPPMTAIKRFLELNLTSETIDFHTIPGVVPNRGMNPQPDLPLYGLHYLQRVTDADKPPFSTAGEALHIEPGLFMNVPASDLSPSPTIARMASIPHGVSVLMQGTRPSSTPTPGPPIIPPIYPIAGLPPVVVPANTPGLGILPINLAPPAGPGGPHNNIATEGDLSTDGPGSQSNGPYPAEFQGYVNDPNSLLRSAIAHQDILGHITISLSTGTPGSSIGNIPFLGLTDPVLDPSTAAAMADKANAFCHSVQTTFWIEWVRIKDGIPLPTLYGIPEKVCLPITELEPYPQHATYLQLQYSQVVVLVFNGVLWPHVSVATLTLSAG